MIKAKLWNKCWNCIENKWCFFFFFVSSLSLAVTNIVYKETHSHTHTHVCTNFHNFFSVASVYCCCMTCSVNEKMGKTCRKFIFKTSLMSLLNREHGWRPFSRKRTNRNVKYLPVSQSKFSLFSISAYKKKMWNKYK